MSTAPTANLGLPLDMVGKSGIEQVITTSLPLIDAAVGKVLTGQKTYDPPSMAAGATGAPTTVTVTGAALGDFVVGVSFSLDTQGIEMAARVSAPDTVTILPRNPTAGTIDLASGTLTVRVRKAG